MDRIAKGRPVLRELGERGDIIKTMHRRCNAKGWRRTVILRPMGAPRNATERIVGRVLDKVLGRDEMDERVRLVINGVDGRVLCTTSPAPRTSAEA